MQVVLRLPKMVESTLFPRGIFVGSLLVMLDARETVRGIKNVNFALVGCLSMVFREQNSCIGLLSLAYFERVRNDEGQPFYFPSLLL